jgi:hypothetical protein
MHSQQGLEVLVVEHVIDAIDQVLVYRRLDLVRDSGL